MLQLRKKKSDVGIWHETYLVAKNQTECIYVNMPNHGLGKILPLVDAKNELATAKGRLNIE